MRVLVSGGSSLLGRSVIGQLTARGDDVSCFQRTPSATNGTDILGDIRDAMAVKRAARDHDAIVHLAALVAPRPDWADAFAVNVGGTRNILHAAADVGRLVHVSSPSVAFDGQPAMGHQANPASYRGRDAYARSKAMAETLVLSHTAAATVVLRPHLVWGPGDTQLVGRIITRALEGRLVLPDQGRAMIDTTYIDDAASGIIAGLDATARPGDAVGRAWVLTGGDPRPLIELVEGILRSAQISTPPRSIPAPLAGLAGRVVGRLWPGDEPPLTHFAARQLSVAHWFDQAETRRVLDWKPQVSVDEGLERLRHWFVEHPVSR